MNAIIPIPEIQQRIHVRDPYGPQTATRSIIRSIDRPVNGSIYGPMEILTLSQAKPRIGRLIERALQGESVVIRKGNRLVQLTEYLVPEPILDRPAGYFRRRAEDYRQANAATANHQAQR
jgi:hypothetical protein